MENNIQNTEVDTSLDSNDTLTNVHYDEPEVVVESDKVEPAKVEPESEAYKPWQSAKKEEVKESVIPYNRFKEVNEEKNAYLNRAMELEKKLADIEARSKELNTVKMPEDIKIEDYTEDRVDEYMRDLLIANQHKTIKEVEERNLAREQMKIVEDHRANLVNNYENTINEAVSRNPEIKDAVNYLDSLLAPETGYKLDADLAYELMIDENAGELIYDICTDKQLLQDLFNSNPKDMIRKLHKMSAKIDREARYATKQEQVSTSPAPEPMARPALKPISKTGNTFNGAPKIKSDVGGRIDPSHMSNREYARYIKNGYKL